MSAFRKLPRRFRLPWRSRDEIRAEVDEELAFHLEMRAEALVREGVGAEEARARARREFGDVEAASRAIRRADEEREREGRRRERLGDLRRDARHAVRVLARCPGFAAATLLTLAAGIGMATAMFSVADGILLRPLPVRDQARVAVMAARDPAAGADRLPLPFAAARAYGGESRAFAEVAAYDYNGAFPRPVRIGAEAENLNVAFVTGSFFRVLGVEPAAGRGLLPEDERAGAAPAVAISHALWERRFGGDPGVLGKTVRLIGREATVVGVMPRGFEIPRDAEVWATTLPFTALPGTDSSWAFVHLVGRLAPGATHAGARAELGAFLRRDDAPLPQPLRGAAGDVRPLEEHLLGDARPLVWALAGAVGLLLLLTVVNVATLFLGRAVERGHEFAVRASLGAGAGRLRVQVITESVVLALAGGALGVAVAHGLVRVLAALAPAELPRADAVRIDARVLLFALVVSLGAALAFGLAPALRLGRAELAGRLRTGGRGGTGSGEARAAQRALVVAQVALALVVLAGAGLLVASLGKLQRLEWGVARERLLLAQLAPPDESAALGREAYRARVDGLVESLRGAPGVVSAAPVLMPPFGGESGWDTPFALEGQTPDEHAENPLLTLEIAAPGHFRTLGIAIVRGRAVTEEDREGGRPVIVVSESVARLAWPGADPVGRRIRIGGEGEPWRTVVGVAGDTRWRELTRVRPTVYLPRAHFAGEPVYLAVRTRVEPAAAAAGVRRAASSAWPGLSLPSVRPLEAYAAEPLARPRFAAALFAAFAAASLLLASVGLYGVMSAHVLQRRREIGIRMALGAERGRVLRSVLGQGMLLAAAGVAIGIAAALALTRVLTSILYGVSPADPATFAAVAALLAAITLLASYLPARRATRVDPMAALRSD